MNPVEAAEILRDAVAALSAGTAVELGDVVAAASPERTAALAEKLERGAARFGAEDVETIDVWIRAADSFMLHDDPAEAEARAGVGRRLRAVRALVAPPAGLLTDDPRDAG
ncbi:MAG TPA: hypothetical protein VKA84_09355, partial [Gemmatimonadaceae bacterium]|nr:hypothetical protein [Gemmatimonadaceae bacterium]